MMIDDLAQAQTWRGDVVVVDRDHGGLDVVAVSARQ